MTTKFLFSAADPHAEHEGWLPPTDPVPESGGPDTLEALHRKVDHLSTLVGKLDRRREEMEELIQDLMPALNGAVLLARDRLDGLDRNGAFANAMALPAAAETALSSLDPADLQALAEATPELIRAARVLASPKVTALAPKMVMSLDEAGRGPAPSMWQLIRQARAPRARRGMGAALSILRALGEGNGAPVNLPAPAAAPLPRAAAPARPAPRPSARPAAAAGPAATELAVNGASMALDADGNLADPNAWTREIAEAFAAQAGLTLTDRHWQVLDFVRKDGASSGAAPGIRKIVAETDVTQKELYQLFPGGPAVLAARLAGLSKPKSCV